jgi:NAD(P)H-dependent FMN reductase
MRSIFSIASGITNGGGSSATTAQGGTRAVESLRLVMAELQVADVRAQVALSLLTDFENFSLFKPAPYHDESFNDMLDQSHCMERCAQGLAEQGR